MEYRAIHLLVSSDTTTPTPIGSRRFFEGGVVMKRAETMGVREAAKQLGVSIKFVYDLVWAGKLPAEKPGKTWRIPLGAVEARLKQQRGA
jgi:excisionase family DNA binding protein